jgi:hypothetical protein
MLLKMRRRVISITTRAWAKPLVASELRIRSVKLAFFSADALSAAAVCLSRRSFMFLGLGRKRGFYYRELLSAVFMRE